MKLNGLSEVEIGLVNTINIVFAFICQIVASPITNKLGRKRTTLIFDLLSWSLSMLIWAIAHDFWVFLFAAVVNAFSKIVSVSWNCLITEDEKKENVPKIYTICSLINSSIGIFALLAGFFITRFGLVESMRALYAIGALSMAISFIARNFLVEETRAGLKLMKDHDGAGLFSLVLGYLKFISRLYENRRFVLFCVLYVTTGFIVSLNIFQVIFLKDHLSFSNESISTVPFVVAIANIAAFLVLVPRLGAMRSDLVLTVCIALSWVGSLFFLIIPEKNLFFMLSVMTASGVSLFVLQAYRDSLFMNSQGEHDKADMFSAVQTLTNLFCIPSGYVGGVLYQSNPLFPFALVSILYLLVLVVSIGLSSRKAMVQGGEMLLEGD